MKRTELKKLLTASAAVVALLFCAAEANAGWWWGAAPSYYGGWDSCCASSCYSGCGWHGRCHRGYRYGCGYGCGWDCGLSCCGNGWTSCYSCYAPVSCCGTCGGCNTCGSTYCGWPAVSSCGCGGNVVYGSASLSSSASTPMAPTPAPTHAPIPEPAHNGSAPSLPAPTAPGAIPTPAAPAAPEGGLSIPTVPGHTSIEPTSADGCVLTVWVPIEAKVTVNGLLTKSTGSRRQFVSYGLRPGFTYKYEVKAEIVREGKVVTETQSVTLTAGGREGVAFGFNTPPATETASN